MKQPATLLTDPGAKFKISTTTKKTGSFKGFVRNFVVEVSEEKDLYSDNDYHLSFRKDAVKK